MQHLAGDHVAQDGPVGLAGPLPAELQGIGAEGGENQWSRSTGCAQREGGSCRGTSEGSEGGGEDPSWGLHTAFV